MTQDIKNQLIQLKKDCIQMHATIKSIYKDKDYNNIGLISNLDDNLDTLEDGIAGTLEDLNTLIK